MTSNRIYNGSVEIGGANGALPTDWSRDDSSSGVTGSTTAAARSGQKSVYVTLAEGSTELVQFGIGHVPCIAGETYTFSAYVNTKDVTAFNGKGAYLLVQADGSTIGVSQPVNYKTSAAVDGGWTRISATFTAGANTYLYVRCAGTGGTVYIDELQLELGGAPGSMDLLRNASADRSYGWTLTNASYGAEGLCGKALRLSSTPDRASSASQVVPINLPGTETYVFSAWGKASAMPDNTPRDVKKYGLKATVTYADGATEDHYQAFNPDVTEWQQASLMIVPKSPSKTVANVTVRCEYGYNNGDALFDELSLTRQAAQTYTYDANGNLKKVGTTSNRDVDYSYNGNNDLTSFTDRTGVTYSYTYGSYHNVTKLTDGKTSLYLSYDAYGNVTRTRLGEDALSIQTSAAYNTSESNSRLTQYSTPNVVMTPDGTATEYTYNDYNGRHDSITVDGFASIRNGYSEGRLSTVTRTASSKTQSYGLSYAAFGDLSGVTVGGRQLASYAHNVRTGDVERLTYGNGDTADYSYNDLDQLTGVRYNGTERFSYRYAGDGRLYEAKDLALNRTHTYTRDDLGRPIYSSVTEGDTTLLYTGRTYDTANRQTGYAYGGAGLPDRTVRYSYFDANGLLAMTTLADGNHTYYYYDALERLTATGTTNTFGREYTYAAPGGTNVGNTTPLVSKLNYSRSGAQLMSFNYTYDSMGRIRSDDSYMYVYDGLGQLTTVKDKSGAVLYSYTYDGAGNILTATENGTTVSYTYGDAEWQDLLTAYNGQEITYDAIGNPTSYRGWTLGWQNGRQLATAAKSGKSVSYAYDVNGIRASKTVDGVKHTYVYDGTQLLAERYGTTRLEFMYNESGQPHLVRYSTNSGSSYVTYYYILNHQGDVMALMDTAGELAVKYTYDPWGKVLTVTNGSGTAITSATHIANVNPLRYRGYY